jgi:hypothetical protein
MPLLGDLAEQLAFFVLLVLQVIDVNCDADEVLF